MVPTNFPNPYMYSGKPRNNMIHTIDNTNNLVRAVTPDGSRYNVLDHESVTVGLVSLLKANIGIHTFYLTVFPIQVDITRKILKNPTCNINALGLYGDKGLGKTQFVNTVAEALNRPLIRISLFLGHITSLSLSSSSSSSSSSLSPSL